MNGCVLPRDSTRSRWYVFLVINRAIKFLTLSALCLVAAFVVWRIGEEFWYGRYPVEDGYAAYRAADHWRAHPILRAHARRGDPRAQTYVGLQYQSGKATIQSERLAAHWVKRAADQDYPDALVIMGLYNLNGIGVDEDLLEARWLFREAADLGHPEGISGLAEIALFHDRNEYSGLPLLKSALVAGSVRARMLSCFHAAPEIYSRWEADADTEILNTCLQAGLDGYEGSLSRAVYLLYSDDSPLRDLERAYQLTIIGLTWWPKAWEDQDRGLGVAARATVLMSIPPPPRPSAPSPSDDPYAGYRLPAYVNYSEAADMLEERIRAIGADPMVVPDPPDFGPHVGLDLDPAAMVRAENAARAFLIEKPRPGSWMQ